MKKMLHHWEDLPHLELLFATKMPTALYALGAGCNAHLIAAPLSFPCLPDL